MIIALSSSTRIKSNIVHYICPSPPSPDPLLPLHLKTHSAAMITAVVERGDVPACHIGLCVPATCRSMAISNAGAFIILTLAHWKISRKVLGVPISITVNNALPMFADNLCSVYLILGRISSVSWRSTCCSRHASDHSFELVKDPFKEKNYRRRKVVSRKVNP